MSPKWTFSSQRKHFTCLYFVCARVGRGGGVVGRDKNQIDVVSLHGAWPRMHVTTYCLNVLTLASEAFLMARLVFIYCIVAK